jgi:hypothetical protein
MVGKHLLVILLISVVDDVEEAELVDTLGGGDDTEPVTELVLLEELLGAVVSLVAVQCVNSRGIRHTGTSSSVRRTGCERQRRSFPLPPGRC